MAEGGSQEGGAEGGAVGGAGVTFTNCSVNCRQRIRKVPKKLQQMGQHAPCHRQPHCSTHECRLSWWQRGNGKRKEETRGETGRGAGGSAMGYADSVWQSES